MTLGFKSRGSEFIDRKSTLAFVIPAQAGIQSFLGLAAQAKMDAGLRRHDKPSLCLKATDFNHPRKGRLKKLFVWGLRDGSLRTNGPLSAATSVPTQKFAT